MHIQSFGFTGGARTLPSGQSEFQAKLLPPGDEFKPSGPEEPKSVSWFHRATGAVAGATALSTAGLLLIGQAGNGMGSSGLIYPALGFVGGAGLGLVAGAIAAGSAHSDENKTALLHRGTAIVTGMVVGGVAGLMLLGPAGNGKGADGLLYAAGGLVGGSVLGGIGLGIAAGRFPDR